LDSWSRRSGQPTDLSQPHHNCDRACLVGAQTLMLKSQQIRILILVPMDGVRYIYTFFFQTKGMESPAQLKATTKKANTAVLKCGVLLISAIYYVFD